MIRAWERFPFNIWSLALRSWYSFREVKVKAPFSHAWVFVNEVAFGKPLDYHRMGLFAREAKLVTRETFSYPLTPLSGKKEGLEAELMTGDLISRASIKIPVAPTRCWKLLGWGPRGPAGRAWKLCTPFPHTLSCVSHPSVSEWYPL